MAERYRQNRPSAIRQPLGELRNRANTPPVQQSSRAKGAPAVTASPHAVLPHNESLDPSGSLAVRGSNPTSPENKRLSQVASEHCRDSKRNSAISTASTNASASGRKRKTYIGHWQLGKTIGKGGCSRVRVVRHKTRNQLGAVKIITRSTAESTRAQSLANLIESTKGSVASSASGHKPIPYGLEREIAVMKLLEHPNIVQLYDVWENRNELYLIMEYVDGGELFHFVEERKGLHEDEAVYIFRQIVSALLYCHRLHICHRDLKPENILLNQKELTVKLIDFGMAALQPEGRLLSTPCGSPHYAAPEVVSSRPYDGTQADVWSCGVILYVMLTGTTPYNYSEDGDLRMLFHDIAKARYWMPEELSREARDLIRRIFVPDPRRRITMDGVWDHPLLHKYDKQFGYVGPAGTKDAAIGNIPTATNFKVKRIQDIDREILRNMRTLWHSEPEQRLVERLLSDEITQEKLFYAALVKHRDENLENYSGPEDMDYSNSDYHHNQAPKQSDVPPVPSVRAPRSQSQYSIMNDEHLRPSPSFVGSPPSVSSYDPYRASKDPIVNARGGYVNVTVHRDGSAGTRKASIGRSLRHQHALRVEVMKQNGRRVSNYSSSSLAASAHSRGSIRRSSASRHSLTSSVWPSSPPPIATMRPSGHHKRAVSFTHLRRTSTTSALISHSSEQTPPTPSIPDTFRDRRVTRPPNPVPPSSSPMSQQQPIRSKKERASQLQTPRIKVRKAAETPSQYMRNDIRKHSAELEKACEEAFFRSSVGSSLTAQTTFSENPGPFDTPPSSVSARASGGTDQLDRTAPRPLPDLPKDTPNTYLAKTLEETREKLAAYKSKGDDNSAKFEEVMKMLETIMPSARATDERRTTSAPESKPIDHLGPLPVISEESGPCSSREDGANWQRSVTAPVQQERRQDERTIRVVPPSSPGIVAPLNVRKRSNGSEVSEGARQALSVKTSRDRMSTRQQIESAGGLEVIDEDTTLISDTNTVRKKRSGWFGLTKKTSDLGRPSSGLATPTTTHDVQERQQRRPSKLLSKPPPEQAATEGEPMSARSSEFPIRKDEARGGRRGLSRWLGKLAREKDEPDSSPGRHLSTDTPKVDDSRPDRSMDSLFSTSSPAPSSDDGPPATGVGRSWFARFFHVKPAAKIICFSIPRGRARQELVILLREWQRHGIDNLQFSKQTNTITASVSKHNALDIKPVSFRIELFVVLEHGRKVGLSIARFVQTKGAASGFKRVLEVVDGVMRGRGWLVEDEEKWRALCEVVGG